MQFSAIPSNLQEREAKIEGQIFACMEAILFTTTSLTMVLRCVQVLQICMHGTRRSHEPAAAVINSIIKFYACPVYNMFS